MDATAAASLWALIALIIFIGILFYYRVPAMITGTLDKRATTIRSDLDEARRLREEAQSLLAEYQRRRKEAEQEAEDIIEQAKREASALTAEAKEKMEDYVARRTKSAEDRIAQAEAQAMNEVRARAVEAASQVAATILAEKTKGEEGDRILEASIADVGRRIN